MYEEELKDVRSLLDKISNEKAEVEIERGRLMSEAEDLREASECDVSRLRKLNGSLSTQLGHKTAQIETLSLALEEACEDMNKLKRDLENGEKQLNVARSQLERETLGRIEAENSLQTMRETAVFDRSVRSGEGIYEDMRDQLDDDMCLVMSRMEGIHQTKALRKELDVRKQQVSSLTDQMTTLTARLKERNQEIEKYIRQISQLEKTLLDKQVEMDEASLAHTTHIGRTEQLLSHLTATLDNTLDEHHDLFAAKVRLDTEIGAYRTLMEKEETRLELDGPRKRRRDSLCSLSTGDVRIVHQSDDTVKLHNTADTVITFLILDCRCVSLAAYSDCTLTTSVLSLSPSDYTPSPRIL
ncbi:prelamin-A/C-like [Octopus sinensis]|uniref:Prelamin-A/C-like n=1 Tax=Octopus sinensis TaxID=2607531 RepID=A0A7E6EKY9_9MOLL|nr:prelamin-A/C-like [Octopus sinensis]